MKECGRDQFHLGLIFIAVDSGDDVVVQLIAQLVNLETLLLQRTVGLKLLENFLIVEHVQPSEVASSRRQQEMLILHEHILDTSCLPFAELQIVCQDLVGVHLGVCESGFAVPSFAQQPTGPFWPSRMVAWLLA
jgi:hypothetical protein